METFSALLALCAGWIPSQRSVTRKFGLPLNKRLSKQSWGWWFETPSRSLWRHCNVELLSPTVSDIEKKFMTTFPRVHKSLKALTPHVRHTYLLLQNDIRHGHGLWLPPRKRFISVQWTFGTVLLLVTNWGRLVFFCGLWNTDSCASWMADWCFPIMMYDTSKYISMLYSIKCDIYTILNEIDKGDLRRFDIYKS